jgi:hypothetical protein
MPTCWGHECLSGASSVDGEQVSGNRRKCALLTLHDTGMDSQRCFQGVLRLAGRESPLVAGFCHYHVVLPGFEEGAHSVSPQLLPVDATKLTRMVAAVVCHYGANPARPLPNEAASYACSGGLHGRVVRNRRPPPCRAPWAVQHHRRFDARRLSFSPSWSDQHILTCMASRTQASRRPWGWAWGTARTC